MKKTLLSLSIAFGLINASSAQVYFFEDFGTTNSTALTNWNTHDKDGDGNNWTGATNAIDPTGETSAISASWIDSGPLTPNNILTTKTAIDLTNAVSGTYLTFDIGNPETTNNWWEEKYSIYITDSAHVDSVLAATPILTEILPYGGKVIKRGINIDNFIGKKVYLSFRHYDCTDENFIILDNIKIHVLTNNEAALTSMNIVKHDTIGATQYINGSIQNNGSDTIHKIYMKWTDGTTTYTDSNSVAIPPFTDVSFTHTTGYTFTNVQPADIAVYICLAGDTIQTNDTLKTNVAGLSALKKRIIVGEEATGTWCGWCPRGAIAMDEMAADHPNEWIGIAVHNNDPMAVADYDQGMNNYISGYPSGIVNRIDEALDPSNFHFLFDIEIKKAPVAAVKISNRNWNNSSNTVSFDVTSEFVSNSSDEYRINAVIVEDHVTGTTSGYDQVNYYSGGGSGAMGGYETLSDPVPAASMVYDHVGRAILGGFRGVAGSVSAPVQDGQSDTHSFTYTFPADHVTTNSHIVGLIINHTTGEIINATKMDVVPTSIENIEESYQLELFPNPSSTFTTLQFALANAENVQIRVIDAMGKNVMAKNYNTINAGRHNINIPTSELSNGMYFVMMQVNGQLIKKQLVVQH